MDKSSTLEMESDKQKDSIQCEICEVIFVNKQRLKIHEASAHDGKKKPTHEHPSSNNGQIELWQFLLELLRDNRHVKIIQWIGNKGEFKLESPHEVAQLWGKRKNKPKK